MALEKQLKAGDILMGFDFKPPAVGGAKGFISAGVVDTSLHVKRVTERIERKFFGVRTIEESEIFKVDFRWLPWVGGKINYANLEGKDILSGFFTGCWMALYKDQNFRVAHIATGDGDCKEQWHAAAGGFEHVKGFLPHLGCPTPYALGLVTQNTDLFKIFLQPVDQVAVINPFRTEEEWMQPERNKDRVRSFAQDMAKQKELSAKMVYGGQTYRILKIQGKMAPAPIPT